MAVVLGLVVVDVTVAVGAVGAVGAVVVVVVVVVLVLVLVVVVVVVVAVAGEVGVGEVQLLIMFHVYIHLCIRKSNHINPVDYIC